MALGRRLAAGVRRLWRPRPLERALEDELDAYVKEATDANVAAGMTPDNAAREARAALGSRAAIHDRVRDVGWETHVVNLWRDLRASVRYLVTHPGFTVVVIATLALGVGTTVTMYGVMQAVVWRPLPYPEAERLVVITRSIGGLEGGLSSAEVRDLVQSSHGLDRIASANAAEAFVEVDGVMEHVSSASASDGMLDLLGAVPLPLGRVVRAATDVLGDRVTGIVVSDRLWRRMLGGDARAIGKRVRVNNFDVTVVGVLPAGLRAWLPASMRLPADVDVWFPRDWSTSRTDDEGAVVARLAPGTTVEQARAELAQFASRVAAEHPGDYTAGFGNGSLRFHLEPMRDVVAAPARGGLTALNIAVAFVFVIAGVNVANLMLIRAKHREREIAVRTALGAGRLQTIRLVLCESLVLAVAGAGAGLLVAVAGVGLLDWLRPVALPRQTEIRVDAAVALASVVLSTSAMVAASLVPMLRLSRAGRHLAPLVLARSVTAEPGHRRLQRVLVVAEVALSIVPLVAAGLLVRTFVNLSDVPLGFDPAHVVTARVPFSLRTFPAAQRWQLQRDVIAAVAALPGVEWVSAASPLPFDGSMGGRRVRRVDDPSGPGFAATEQSVLPGYLPIVGTPILHGRDFANADFEERRDVAIVDELFARELGYANAVGQRFLATIGGVPRTFEIVGQTAPIRMTPVRERRRAHMLFPYPVLPVVTSLVMKTERDAAALGPLVKETVERLGTGRAVYAVEPMDANISESLADTRFAMLVLAIFAAIAVLLVSIGLYGTLAYLIAQRTKEFGLRLALGASPGRIVRFVAGEGIAMMGIGAALGVLGAMAVAGTLDSLLYGVSPLDGLTLAAVGGVVLVVATIAVGYPAARAARLDPAAILRSE